MEKKFVLRPKSMEIKEDKLTTISLRMERELKDSYDRLAWKSGRSRNEVLCMALRYALENIETE